MSMDNTEEAFDQDKFAASQLTDIAFDKIDFLLEDLENPSSITMYGRMIANEIKIYCNLVEIPCTKLIVQYVVSLFDHSNFENFETYYLTVRNKMKKQFANMPATFSFNYLLISRILQSWIQRAER